MPLTHILGGFDLFGGEKYADRPYFRGLAIPSNKMFFHSLT